MISKPFKDLLTINCRHSSWGWLGCCATGSRSLLKFLSIIDRQSWTSWSFGLSRLPRKYYRHGIVYASLRLWRRLAKSPRSKLLGTQLRVIILGAGQVLLRTISHFICQRSRQLGYPISLERRRLEMLPEGHQSRIWEVALNIGYRVRSRTSWWLLHATPQ